MQPWREAPAADARASREAYTLLRCAACGSAAVDRWDAADASRLYRGGAYGRMPGRLDAAIDPLRRLGDRRIVSALGLAPRSRVLDVGAGDGRLVRVLRAAGHDAHGIEPFAESTDETVAAVPLEDAELDGGGYDAIVLWHVLEHLADPAEALSRLRPVLRPGATLLVSVPNLASVQAAIGRERWFHLDVPRHAVHFTDAGLRRLLARTGFAADGVSTFALDQGLLGMTQTLLNLATRRTDLGFASLKGRGGGVAGLAGLAAAAAPAVVIEAAAVAAGRGGVLTVRARARS
jgi:SAM-dependent methyltransferase